MTSEAEKTEKKKYCPACKREFPSSLLVCKVDNTLLIPIKADPLLGSILADKYLIEQEIGRGGMSIVYRGRHELMDRRVAIKMLQTQLVEDITSKKRFQQEAKAASCLQHPNLIGVYDFGFAPVTGQPYLVMDFLDGESLIDIIRRENHIEVMRALNIFIQACDALQHAHQKGVIHRDLKSGNIMLTPFEDKVDVVKVVDFGIAKLMPSSGKEPQNLTQTGEIFGSPIYMSPEQCLGQPLDARSDIYSMGAMLYEALTGEPPLMGDTVITTMQMHVSEMPAQFDEVRPDLRIPIQLQRICFKALEKRPENRFTTMEEFKIALQRVDKQLQGGEDFGDSSSGETGSSSQLQKVNSPKSTRQNLTGQRSAISEDIPKPRETAPKQRMTQPPAPAGSARSAIHIQRPSQPSMANSYSQRNTISPSYAVNVDDDTKNSGKTKTIIICLLVALVLIGVGYAVYAVIMSGAKQ